MQAKKTVISSLLISLALATAFATPSSVASQEIAPFPDVCPDQNMVLRPSSDFPDTAIGRVRFMLQSSKMEYSVLCQVDKARRLAGLKDVQTFKFLGKGPHPRGLAGAAYDHATAAAQLRWWGTVAQYPTCTKRIDDPSTSLDESTLCDPHINPETKSTPQKRAQDLGFGNGCTKWKIGENTYTGWGDPKVTPKAAFDWWMGSKSHHDTMMDPEFDTMYLTVVWGSADPAAGWNTPAATYVQEFGRCWK
ncbi:CAP domain-containing protein [Streptomyces mirabilis]|uniref:CAP domain-containing protein n=1 Tax=Streptomyces mirabilis TaxID=68239 RepID=UPI002F913E9A